MLAGSSLKSPMNTGKMLFAQVMDFLPWKAFSRIVARYAGDSRVRALSCGEHYRAMAFAQLAHRKSLRDIETCQSVQALQQPEALAIAWLDDAHAEETVNTGPRMPKAMLI